MRIEEVDGSRHPDLRARLTIAAPDHTPLRSLEPAQFRILENEGPGRHPSEVRRVEDSGHALHLVFLLQNSGSWSPAAAEAKRAISQLMRRMRQDDRVAVLAYADDAKLLHGWGSTDEAIAALEHLPEAGLEKRLSAGLQAGLSLFAPAKKEEIQALLLLSDGQDSSPVAGDLVHLARQGGIPIHTLAWSQSGQRGFALLSQLGETSGGSFQRIGDPSRLGVALERVHQSLLQQVVLSWKSAAPSDGKSHRLEVELHLGNAVFSAESQLQTPLRHSPWPIILAVGALVIMVIALGIWLWSKRPRPFPTCRTCQRQLLHHWPICPFCLKAAPARLKVVSGTGKGLEFPLGEGLHNIGKAPNNSIALNDASLSKLHCTVVVDGGRIEVQDRGSTNGTFVNAQRIARRTLRHGDQLGLGRCVLELMSRGQRGGDEVG